MTWFILVLLEAFNIYILATYLSSDFTKKNLSFSLSGYAIDSVTLIILGLQVKFILKGFYHLLKILPTMLLFNVGTILYFFAPITSSIINHYLPIILYCISLIGVFVFVTINRSHVRLMQNITFF
jgi:hypothetical protein